VWSDSLDVDAISTLLRMQPSTWLSDGQAVAEGKPPHYGNQWVLVSSASDPVSEIAAKLRTRIIEFQELLSHGARAVRYCRYRRFPGSGLPILSGADSILLADLSIGVALLPTQTATPPTVRAD